MIKYHAEVIQGSEEWHALRCGILTASEMKHIITPTLKIASNDKERGHLYELLAQRVTGFIEPKYISDDMLRGNSDELDARILYNSKYEPVEEVGFITNDKLGFKVGFSPDGIVGEKKRGFIEVKSRMQKYQAETILIDDMPADFLIQVQTGFLVSELDYCAFVSYCGGMPFFVKKIYPDTTIINAIENAAKAFEERLQEKIASYREKSALLIPTVRRIEEEIVV